MKNLLIMLLKCIKDDWVYKDPASIRIYRGFWSRGACLIFYLMKTLIIFALILICLLLCIFYYIFYGMYLILKIIYDKEEKYEAYDEDYEDEEDCYEDDCEEIEEYNEEYYDEEKHMTNITSYYMPKASNALKFLWYSGSESDWKEALNSYDAMLNDNHRAIENYINNIDADEVKNMDVNEFYRFLYDKYFPWKFTDGRILKSNRERNLEKYIRNNELHVLDSIHKRLFTTSRHDIYSCLNVVEKIYGVATAAGSGLLAILFPEDFGTVDRFVVERLQELDDPNFKKKLDKMKPESLNTKDGVYLIQIMRTKAAELNAKFDTDFWTPRKIDMVLWSFGR